MADLTPIIVPIIVSVILSISGAFVVSKYTGPAQQAYVAALEGRLKVVTDERGEAWERIPKLEARIQHALQHFPYPRNRHHIPVMIRLKFTFFFIHKKFIASSS